MKEFLNFRPIGGVAGQIVAQLEADLTERRAEILEEAADEFERMAIANRELAQKLRAGQR